MVVVVGIEVVGCGEIGFGVLVVGKVGKVVIVVDFEVFVLLLVQVDIDDVGYDFGFDCMCLLEKCVFFQCQVGGLLIGECIGGFEVGVVVYV